MGQACDLLLIDYATAAVDQTSLPDAVHRLREGATDAKLVLLCPADRESDAAELLRWVDLVVVRPVTASSLVSALNAVFDAAPAGADDALAMASAA